MPSLFDRTDYGLSAGVIWTIRAVRGMSVVTLVLMLYAVAAFSQTGTSGQLILVGMIAIGLIIPIIASYWIAISRPPSPAQVRIINQIASVSETQRRRIQAIYNQDMLTFAEARRICAKNIHLRDEAEMRAQQVTVGPQASCEITDGENVTLRALGNDIVFVPCVDGWYRFHNRDEKLHRMLAAGACGSDAGIYWSFDHREGVWGVPASFVHELPPRLKALDRMVKAV